MKRSLTAVAVALTLGSAGCDTSNAPAKNPDAAEKAEAPTAVAPTTPAVVAPSAEPAAAAPGSVTPAFAAIYPGGEIEGQPTLAGGPSGPGGLVTFTTEATPDDVVKFYRERAEAAGLAPVMSMNQGDARAYGAAQAATDASVQVVASPAEDGDATSVQLSWSAGQ